MRLAGSTTSKRVTATLSVRVEGTWQPGIRISGVGGHWAACADRVISEAGRWVRKAAKEHNVTTSEVRQLFAYDAWANGLVFEAAAGLSEAQQVHSVASSFPSVAATLAHVVGAEWVWLRRWLGESPAGFPEWVSHPSVTDLRDRLTVVERDIAAFVAGLSDADLDRPVMYRNLAGQAFSDRLGGLMQHVVNHSTYHRGQIATQFRQMGVKPPGTDLILFLRQTQ